jgi:hypothetical protein
VVKRFNVNIDTILADQKILGARQACALGYCLGNTERVEAQSDMVVDLALVAWHLWGVDKVVFTEEREIAGVPTARLLGVIHGLSTDPIVLRCWLRVLADNPDFLL